MSDESRDLKEKMTNLSDDELLKIVHDDFADYREETINIVKEELKKRNVEFSQPDFNIKDENKKTKSFLPQKLIIAGIIFYIISYLLKAPSNATLSYHIVSILIPMISYTIILGVISCVIPLIFKNSNRLKIFSWLFFGATLFDLLVSIFRLFVMYKTMTAL